jgi:Putative phage holin Dp-1
MDEYTGEHEEIVVKNPWLSDKMYANLEWVARVLLPSAATLYLALATLWGFPYGPQIVGTIVAVDTFLGVFIGMAQRSYDQSGAAYNGTIVAQPGDAGTALSGLVLDKDPAELQKLVLKVVQTSE